MNEPKKFTKKPVEIDAWQFEGGASSATPIIDWVLAGNGNATWSETYDDWDPVAKEYFEVPEAITITTLEGLMQCQVGDWVIKGVKGEFYPCKPDIFEQTYTPSEAPVIDFLADYDTHFVRQRMRTPIPPTWLEN